MRQHDVTTDTSRRVQKFGLHVSSDTSWFSFNPTKPQAQSGKWGKELIPEFISGWSEGIYVKALYELGMVINHI